MTSVIDLSRFSEKDLLKLHAKVIDELKKRGVVRTRNNPVGDYTEWLVAKALRLELAGNSEAGYDAIDSQGVSYQIKGRRTTPENQSRQLSVIRSLEAQNFDLLAAVIFNANYDVVEAVLVPHEVIEEYGRYREHVNGHVLHLRGDILSDPRVKKIDSLKSAS